MWQTSSMCNRVWYECDYSCAVCDNKTVYSSEKSARTWWFKQNILIQRIQEKNWIRNKWGDGKSEALSVSVPPLFFSLFTQIWQHHNFVSSKISFPVCFPMQMDVQSFSALQPDSYSGQWKSYPKIYLPITACSKCLTGNLILADIIE